MQTTSTETSSTTDSSEQLTPLRVGIQGYTGAFHEIATRRFFSDRPLSIVPAHTFPELISSLLDGSEMDIGLMAIENTLAGSLMANYRLLLENAVRIVGEVFLRIEQNLLVLPGVKIEELQEVHSHPVAIAQCREFFLQHPHIQLVETVDTALSAREVQENSWRHVGAIASNLAADVYDLETLAAGIETNKQNHTRFLVLERDRGQQPPAKANKVSVSFTVDHTVGSLYKVLAVLSAYNVNLTKIQSAPIIGKPWEYLFFIDFMAEGAMGWEQALDAIRPITHELHLLGAYVQGVKN
ncbi:MAG: prephenate dehydratase [Bacteroidota bacterium]